LPPGPYNRIERRLPHTLSLAPIKRQTLDDCEP
jgi:hypothetical protein